mmetsp:Transcript_28129/g.41981  ORF Transcript_28129/g.41981 Transcript_28129/m.41981 type:complete len:229 (+) Transcript_28129:1873-2559(+)
MLVLLQLEGGCLSKYFFPTLSVGEASNKFVSLSTLPTLSFIASGLFTRDAESDTGDAVSSSSELMEGISSTSSPSSCHRFAFFFFLRTALGAGIPSTAPINPTARRESATSLESGCVLSSISLKLPERRDGMESFDTALDGVATLGFSTNLLPTQLIAGVSGDSGCSSSLITSGTGESVILPPFEPRLNGDDPAKRLFTAFPQLLSHTIEGGSADRACSSSSCISGII